MIGNPTEGLKPCVVVSFLTCGQGRMIGNPTEGLKQVLTARRSRKRTVAE